MVPAHAGIFNSLDPKDQIYWKKLLHYNDQKSESKIDGENFFLSKNKKDPEAELIATINAFKSNQLKVGWFNYEVGCVFRARLEFLKKVNLIEKNYNPNCKMFDDWKQGLNANSLTLVFSSSYPNNPASMFGHTFIRINQKNKSSDLNDYAIAFSALPNGDDNGLMYAYKGLTGGYRGLIEITKYYTKVTDYNNSESRDLLEYDLSFTTEEVDRFLDHVWEIYQTTYADYFFHDENCSAFLADLLAIAVDDDFSINQHHKWYYLPGELIQTVHSHKNLVTHFHKRTSLKKALVNEISNLSADEIQEVKSNNIDTKNVKVLDAIIHILEYKKNKNDHQLSKKDNELFRKALIHRTRWGSLTTSENLIELNNLPEKSHDTYFASLKYKNFYHQSLLSFEFKNGYHHLMGRDLGYDSFSEFDFLTASFLYAKKQNKIAIDELKLLEIYSIHPIAFYDFQFSWVLLKYDLLGEAIDSLSHRTYGRASGGMAMTLDQSDRLGIDLGLFAEISDKINKGQRTGPLFQLYYLKDFNDQLKLGIYNEWRTSLIKNKDQYQNISTFRFNFHPNKNDEWFMDLQRISKFKSFDTNANTLSVGYGKHF